MGSFYQEQMATIYCGNALEVLRELPDESSQMAMTSPPYWGLRNYAGGTDIVWGGDDCEHKWDSYTAEFTHENRQGLGSKAVSPKVGIHGKKAGEASFCRLCGAWRGQLGLEPTPELYVEHLMMIFQEVKRVLRKDGSFYLNIGDTYASSGCGYGSPPDPKWPTARNNQDKQLEPRRLKALPPKCMVCIPERVMFAMIEDGWILRNKNIWHKSNAMPGSQKDRFTTTWEYLYFFGKNSKTILWRNRETGEWRDTRPTKQENYPWGGMYQHKETGEFSWEKPPESEKNNWIKYQPLWMGFDHYFDLDAVRVPHKTQSLERYQRQVNFGDKTPQSKYADTNPYPEGQQPIYREGRNLAPQWFQEMFPEDKDYKGKFDDLFGHGPNPQSFNLRIRDVKRGKGGTFVQGGQVKELKASEKEIEDYEYPGKTAFQANKEPYLINNPHLMRLKKDKYIALDPEHPNDLSHPKGKNPGDYWEITTQPSSICVCPKCEAVFPRYTKVCPSCNVEGVVGHFAPYPVALCEMSIKASTRLGDVVLDPLAGGGNTGVAAKKLGRRCILIDVVRSYCVMARYKLSKIEYQPGLEIPC